MKTAEAPPVRNEGHRHETRLNITISRVLVVGLIVSVVLLLIGVVLTVVRPGLTVTHTSFVRGIPRAIAALEPDGFFEAGLLVLLATPAARVVALFFAYVRRRRWMFAGISLFVFVILALSAFLGLRAG